MGAGVRVRESIVLHGASLHVSRVCLREQVTAPTPAGRQQHPAFPSPSPQDHTCVLNTIVGWDSTIGRWARVEGTPSDPNPNDPYAKIDSETLFRDGRLTPSITILGTSLLQGMALALLSQAAPPLQLNPLPSPPRLQCHHSC